MIEYWTFSLFYCASELWGSVVISVLFWSLANEVCTVTEAKVRQAAARPQESCGSAEGGGQASVLCAWCERVLGIADNAAAC